MDRASTSNTVNRLEKRSSGLRSLSRKPNRPPRLYASRARMNPSTSKISGVTLTEWMKYPLPSRPEISGAATSLTHV